MDKYSNMGMLEQMMEQEVQRRVAERLKSEEVSTENTIKNFTKIFSSMNYKQQREYIKSLIDKTEYLQNMETVEKINTILEMIGFDEEALYDMFSASVHSISDEDKKWIALKLQLMAMKQEHTMK